MAEADLSKGNAEKLDLPFGTVKSAILYPSEIAARA
jgi:hypothetical protein